MKRYFYFVARYFKLGRENCKAGIQETNEGYFDIVAAAKAISEQEEVDIKKVIISFWAETNSVMMGKFGGLRDASEV